MARLCDQDTECSASYTLSLDRKWVTGMPCNDISMLPPHGRDQRVCQTMEADVAPALRMFDGVTLADWRNHPFVVPHPSLSHWFAAATARV
jgi:hypothetical protein